MAHSVYVVHCLCGTLCLRGMLFMWHTLFSMFRKENLIATKVMISACMLFVCSFYRFLYSTLCLCCALFMWHTLYMWHTVYVAHSIVGLSLDLNVCVSFSWIVSICFLFMICVVDFYSLFQTTFLVLFCLYMLIANAFIECFFLETC